MKSLLGQYNFLAVYNWLIDIEAHRAVYEVIVNQRSWFESQSQ